jgi:sugar fermentation stimulation protein A
MADPGRLRELLVPGVELRVRPADRPGRSTRWSAVLVRSPEADEWVSIDTTLPNRLVRRALEERALPELDDWRLERAEWPHEDSRLDFLLRRAGEPEGPRLALEVKSVTLVHDGVAWFPDAVTARGARHLDHLAELASRPGWQAALLFVVQRGDAREIRAAAHLDPHFAERLAAARSAGVRVLGRRCRLSGRAIRLGSAIPTR